MSITGKNQNRDNTDNMLLTIIVIIVVALIIVQNINNFTQIKKVSEGQKITDKANIIDMPKPI